MAIVRLTRAIEFCSSLRYWNPELSDGENRRIFGRKSDPHGHNYELEVTLRGEPDPVTGMVVNLTHLKEVLDREIFARFDHRDLNRDTPYFEKEPPTPENFVRVIHRILLAALPAGSLDQIRLKEDADTWVDLRAADAGQGVA
ncbi:MAG: 6-carboxytetrahydropterin synthase [Myxococcales bacterium]|nr:6-carboxytetrahydropterin synthase [Myxococcales bacterium]MDH5305681.1 6-carboxytetrahydropterin synthase [Myxococcales bacterium]